MFQEWGFLLTEIWALLALAALLGLTSGWLMFGGGQTATAGGDADRMRAENAKLQSQLVALQAQASAGGAADTLAGKKPSQLDAPNGGQADDLKRIQGIEPRLEQMCNMLGFWHYDQIAKWSEAEVAWVDENLQGFRGSVSRDDWVSQAKILAEGGQTDFAKAMDEANAEDKAE